MFKFALPWAFLLLPLPFLLRWLLPITQQQPGVALKVPFYARFRQVAEAVSPTTRNVSRRRYLLLACWICLVVAAARPQWLGEPIEIERNGRNIMMALDISGSMQIPDMKLNKQAADRLSVVKQLARRFIQGRQGDQLGLILFGSRAYLQTPITFDLATVRHMLDDATIGLAGAQTALGDALGLAVKHLVKTDERSRVLILLTDGANNAGSVDPLQMARLAAREKIKIYTIGLGAERMTVPGMLGPQVINPSSDLDEAALKHIAKISGGVYFRAQDTQSLQQIYKRINKLEPSKGKNSVFRPVNEFYYLPLFFALVLSVIIALGHVSLHILEQQHD